MKKKLAEVVEEVIKLKVVDKKTGLPIWSEMIGDDYTRASAVGSFVIEELTDEEVEIKSQGYLPINSSAEFRSEVR